jgi:hypothetical protein
MKAATIVDGRLIFFEGTPEEVAEAISYVCKPPLFSMNFPMPPISTEMFAQDINSFEDFDALVRRFTSTPAAVKK